MYLLCAARYHTAFYEVKVPWLVWKEAGDYTCEPKCYLMDNRPCLLKDFLYIIPNQILERNIFQIFRLNTTININIYETLL